MLLFINIQLCRNVFFCLIFLFVVLAELSEAEQEPVSESLALPSGPRRVECPEDEEFLSALDKMVSENIQERIREPVKTGSVDISVPTILKSSKKTYDQLQVSHRIVLNLFFAIIYINFLGGWRNREKHNGFCSYGTQRQ